MKNDFCFGSRNITSISSICTDQKIVDTVRTSDYIRNETLRRLTSIPSYPYKTLSWKNRYYDVIRNKVIKELGV